MPSVAIRELENDPDHTIGKILYLRAFAAAKAAVDAPGDTPQTPLTELAQVIEVEHIKAVLEEQNRA